MGYQDYDEDEDQAPKPKNGLREQLEAALAQNKTLQQEVATLKGQVRQRTVQEILTTKGVDPRIAKYIPAEAETEEAINAWLAEEGELFGVRFDQSGETSVQEPAGKAQGNARLRDLNSAAQTPNRVQDFESRLANAQTDDEIAAIWAEVQKFVL